MRPAPARAARPGWIALLAAVAIVVVTRYAVVELLDGTPPLSADRDAQDPSREGEYGKPRVIGRLQVPELTELSGLATSQRNPGSLWAHNDSGDGPFIYCLRTSGVGCGIWQLDGARAVDWEDIAAAPDERGEPSLYVADIGDNTRSRATVSVYRVEEPRASVTDRNASPSSPTGTLQAETFTFTYPDRPHDAEAIVVNQETGDLYVITKGYSSRSIVFVARAPLVDRAELERVASMKITGLLSDRTGASLAPTGDRIVFSTYAGGYELRLPPGKHFDSIWGQKAVPVDLGAHEQGEAVTYAGSGDTIISASEGARSAIYAVERRD